MSTLLKPVDVVIVGLGWTGGIMAKELATTGLKIVALERGTQRDTNPDFLEPAKDDELRYVRRHELMQDVSRETITFRNKASETALPMRQLGAYLPGETVGGAGVHWNGILWRWLEWDHEPRKQTVERYGANIIPEDMTLQDWGLTYSELEPYYEKFELLCGVSGKAGNLNSQIVAGGNPFEGPRRREFPNPPLTKSQSMLMFEKASRELGYHPFPSPAANASQVYTNPDGVTFGQCHYCGFCEFFGCEVNAKASPHFTVIPLALQSGNVELRARSRVLRVNLDSTRRKAVSVTYLDARGREMEQPAGLVILSAYQMANVHLMLLSGIGEPYDPRTGRGVVGRSYAHQCNAGVRAFFDDTTITNPFMGSGANGVCLDDVNGGNYDFAKEGYIGGGGLSVNHTGGRPIAYRPVPQNTPRWGSEWKKNVVTYYNRTINIASRGSFMSYKQNYLDLDPTYRDAFGRPLLRMTFDFQPNELKQMKRQIEIATQIARAMGAIHVDATMPPVPYSIVAYQSTHNTGGAVMGADPHTSALNKYLQAWDVPNVFVLGATAYPQNAGKNPTGPVGALAYWAADAIKTRYLKAPGPLVPA